MVPSSVRCSHSKTTARWKFGSSIKGSDINKLATWGVFLLNITKPPFLLIKVNIQKIKSHIPIGPKGEVTCRRGRANVPATEVRWPFRYVGGCRLQEVFALGLVRAYPIRIQIFLCRVYACP